jgi:hypothetical protein
MRRKASLIAIVVGAAALVVSGGIAVGATIPGPGTVSQFSFDMVRSTAAVNAHCLSTNAEIDVTITKKQHNEEMELRAEHLPPNTNFDLFVIQLPDAPFGVAWYQSDLQTDSLGNGFVEVQGRFNIETFSLSQGGPANGSNPNVDVTGKAIKDTNVVFRPTHQYHLGLWFNSPSDAVRAGCPNKMTPFNGEQNAGIQALSTRNFPVADGPLEAIK